MIVIFCDWTSQPQNVINFLLFDFPNFSNKIYWNLDLLSHGIIILNMKQKVVKCYIIPLPRLSYIRLYIYWFIYLKWKFWMENYVYFLLATMVKTKLLNCANCVSINF